MVVWRSALAEAELEYNDQHVSTALYVKFPLRRLPDELWHKLGKEYDLLVTLSVWRTLCQSFLTFTAHGIIIIFLVHVLIFLYKTHAHWLRNQYTVKPGLAEHPWDQQKCSANRGFHLTQVDWNAILSANLLFMN